MKTISLELKSNPYNIYIGRDILSQAGVLLKKTAAGKKVMIVSNKKIYGLYGKKLSTSLSKYFEVSVFLMPDGEKYKTINTVNKIYDAAAANRLDRNSVIVALGGGVVGDTAGFAAATYMRGIEVVQIPTSLLAMVDSSIGGKTAVDLKAGKNLAGAFHQPLLVLIDLNTLQTLPNEEYINGMAEVIKYGIIMNAPFFNYIKKNSAKILKKDKIAVSKIVEESVQSKAKIVAKDEKEITGLRAILNYGHTIGHAIEAESGYKSLKHGQAITIGMLAAANIALDMKICKANTVAEQLEVFKAFDLIKPLKKLNIENIVSRLLNDKKVKNGKVSFVLANKIGIAKLNKNIPMAVIKAELKNILK
ncbi:MAG: 3-dehydroquinate synthase [bacterium]